MTKAAQERQYKTYVLTWILLLILTLAMLLTDLASLKTVAVILFLLAAMLVKASLIGANFMHLRFEKLALAVVVAVGILGTAAVLFFLIAVDGARVHELSPH